MVDGTRDELGGGEVLRWRLRSQRLTGEGFAPTGAGAAAAVRWSAAVQAQDHQPTLWSIARRCGGVPEVVLAAAFDAGAFVRTHVLRPTWHVVPPERLRTLLALTGDRVAAGLAARWRDLGLPAGVRERACDVLVAAIGGHGPLTRAGARDVLAGAGIDPEGQRLPHLLMAAELAGVLCSGPVRGGQQTWALLDDRCPPPGPPPDRAAAVRELVLAVVRSHAPLTERDLAWWSGLPLTELRAGLEAGRPELDVVEACGLRLWHAGVPRDLPAPGAVHLVPSFDEFLVAHTQSRGLADPHGFARHMPREALLGPGVLVDGVLAGRWSRTLAAGRVDVTVTAFTPLAPAVRAGLEAEAERYATFAGRPLRLRVDEPG